MSIVFVIRVDTSLHPASRVHLSHGGGCQANVQMKNGYCYNIHTPGRGEGLYFHEPVVDLASMCVC